MSLPFGLYGVADATYGDPLTHARLLLDEGVRLVQLRCKAWPDDALAALADQVMTLAHPHGALVVINDNPGVARRVGAWAHLGQDDGPDLDDLPFGRSTHTLDQVAHVGRAAYVGFGPVFGTATKETGYTARGLEALAEAVAASPVPVVAIGGIGPVNVERVRHVGAHGWAVIGAIWTSPDPRAAIRALR